MYISLDFSKVLSLFFFIIIFPFMNGILLESQVESQNNSDWKGPQEVI